MPTLAADRRHDEGLGPAAKEVVDHASALARLEIRLALLEVKQKLTALGIGIGLLAGAGIVALFAVGFGLATATAGLATVVPTWLALLIVTAVLLVVTGTLVLIGLGLVKKSAPPVPEQAIAEAKRTGEAVRTDGGRRG